MIELVIPWAATSWLAPQLCRGRFYDPRESEKRAVRCFLKCNYKAPLLTGPLCVEFTFHYRPPKSVSKKIRSLMLTNTTLLPSKRDCTNCQKLYEDCLQGIIIDNDKNVRKISSEKLYSEKDEIIIRIWTWQQYEDSFGRHRRDLPL